MPQNTKTISTNKARRISHRVKDPGKEPKLKIILRMVKLGCAVFPVAGYEKKPAIRNWVNDASKDPQKIRKYFLANANSNYGILTGAQSGIFVIDLDGIEGVRNF
jgi:hypothetical protein